MTNILGLPGCRFEPRQTLCSAKTEGRDPPQWRRSRPWCMRLLGDNHFVLRFGEQVHEGVSESLGQALHALGQVCLRASARKESHVWHAALGALGEDNCGLTLAHDGQTCSFQLIRPGGAERLREIRGFLYGFNSWEKPQCQFPRRSGICIHEQDS